MPCSLAAVSSSTPADLVAFAHASLFSPALSTLQTALDRGYLSDFQGLTATSLRKHPPQSIAMIKGHLDQARKNQRSTKPRAAPSASPPPTATDTNTAPADHFPTSDPTNARTHHCYAAVCDPTTGQIHSDQTGRFIVASSTGNNYILVVYDYDSNSILVEPMKSRTGACILKAFTVLHARLVTAGLRPLLQRLDNECSAALKTFLRAEQIDYQLVPPSVHRRNAAERAIRTFKNHFIAGLCSVDKHFPLHLWDKLLPQAETTLNLLRGSRINPKLSAYAQRNGHFDCNRTPLAPPGIRVLVHVKPQDRTTWSPHGEDGWYIGPALESYRCYTVWIWESRSPRICDTLTWLPTILPMPNSSSTDLILRGIHDIVHALHNPSPASPLAPLTTNHYEALLRVTDLLTAVVTPPPPLPTVEPPLRVDASTPSVAVLLPPTPPVTTALPTPPLRVCMPPSPPDPPVRVVGVTSLPPSSVPVPIIRKVQFAPLPSDLRVDTFRNTTGVVGKRRRRARRNRPTPTVLHNARTLHPNKHRSATPRAPPVSRPLSPASPVPHTHGTRLASQLRLAKKGLRHVSAAARTVILAAARASTRAPSHFALHTAMLSIPTLAKLLSIGS